MTSINNLIKVKVFKDEVSQMETEEIQYVGQIFKFKCPRFLSVKLTTMKQTDIQEIQKLEQKVRKKKKNELLLIGSKQYSSILTAFLRSHSHNRLFGITMELRWILPSLHTSRTRFQFYWDNFNLTICNFYFPLFGKHIFHNILFSIFINSIRFLSVRSAQ